MRGSLVKFWEGEVRRGMCGGSMGVECDERRSTEVFEMECFED